MSTDGLLVLGKDIIKTGRLTSKIALWRADPKSPLHLLDGRNRLDAIEMAAGKPVEIGAPSIMAGDFLDIDAVIELDGCKVDPWAYVASANMQRRHLTAEDKRQVIANLIKALPEKPDRQIAAMLGVSHHTVGTVRAEMEGRGQIAHVETRVDTRGRKQPAAKRTRNTERATIYRRMKLGDDTVDKLKGTSLASAREMDALIFLNRGAREGELTPEVEQLVADAIAGRTVSAVETKNGAIPPRDDIGSASSSEVARKDAEIETLRCAKRRLEITVAGLESEIEELKAENAALRAQLEAAQVVVVPLESTTANTVATDDPGPMPDFLLRKPKATNASDSNGAAI
jgi:hypothetical protein